MELDIYNTVVLPMEAFPRGCFPHGSCITIGVFDGVHRGHQAIIDRLIEQSTAMQLPAIIFVIEPNPKSVMHEHDIRTLTSLPERIARLLRYARDKAQHAIPVYCIHIPFNKNIAKYPAQKFIDDVLIPFCSVQYIVLGNNASFGSDKGISLHSHGYSIEYIDIIYYKDLPVSSTRIRECIEYGDMESASHCLGRYFSSTGIVVHGYRRGSTLLGFPTANITIPSTCIPAQGVYAVYVTHNNTQYIGVMNIGTNPTFAGTNLSLETHIIDFNAMIYGDILTIHYCTKLRDEQQFTDVNDLIQQINLDIQMTKEYIHNSI